MTRTLYLAMHPTVHRSAPAPAAADIEPPQTRRPIGSPLLPQGPRTYPLSGGAPGFHAEDLSAHLTRFGPRPAAAGQGAQLLLGALAEVGLSGHGGGHFPVARKWETALRRGGGGIVVANAAESEPASAKDRALLTSVPHLVLDGLACAAEVMGASSVVLWTHEGRPDIRHAIAKAQAERRSAGLTDLDVRVREVRPHYLSGESSAILRALAGGPPLPDFSRQPAAAEGYRGRPAVVHNVETLARIGLLARTGARGHRPSSLVTVTTPHGRTVLELDVRASVAQAVHAAGWMGPEPQAILAGGYGGSWLPWETARMAEVSERGLRAAGGGLGAGVLLPLAASECGIVRAAKLADYLAQSGAGQCGPCRFGLPALAERLDGLARGKARRDEADRLRELGALVDGRGGCHHPDGAVRMVLTALATFAADVERHAQGRPCAAAQAEGVRS